MASFLRFLTQRVTVMRTNGNNAPNIDPKPNSQDKPVPGGPSGGRFVGPVNGVVSLIRDVVALDIPGPGSYGRGQAYVVDEDVPAVTGP